VDAEKAVRRLLSGFDDAVRQNLLDRLTKAGVLHWTSIRADDTRTLNRLVKKGAAISADAAPAGGGNEAS
jgi:hypothetical protein